MMVPEKYRVKTGPMATTAADGNNGLFFVPNRKGPPFKVIASNGLGWDHVSVSLPNRTPTWDEMCRIKRLFFLPEEVAIQYHPGDSEYVNVHPFCLHLWRNQTVSFQVPPAIMV